MSAHLDLPFTASLVAFLPLSRLSTQLDLQLWCQFYSLFIWAYLRMPVLFIIFLFTWTYLRVPDKKTSNPAQLGFGPLLKTLILFEYFPFFPKVFLKLFFFGCANLLTLHPYFRQENIYLMQCVMQCMIMNDMPEYLNLSFLFEFVLFLCFRIFLLFFAHVSLTGLLV